MRRTFIEELAKLARKDPTIILIVCDVGFSYIEDFAKEFPKQFVNAGVIEQSATGIAAGLALSGWKPYLYTMIPFVCMRNYEQVRNDICYNKANVKLIGVQGSVHYKFLGFSHNITENEDKKILKHLPNLSVHIPKNTQSLKRVLINSYKTALPAYIRL